MWITGIQEFWVNCTKSNEKESISFAEKAIIFDVNVDNVFIIIQWKVTTFDYITINYK